MLCPAITLEWPAVDADQVLVRLKLVLDLGQELLGQVVRARDDADTQVVVLTQPSKGVGPDGRGLGMLTWALDVDLRFGIVVVGGIPNLVEPRRGVAELAELLSEVL
jgi:hypothetical protein